MPDGKPYTEIGEFNGFPTITVYTGRVWQGKPQVACTLGLKKAQAVDECIDDIRAFIDSGGSGKPNRSGLEKQADRILRNAGENPEAVGSSDLPF